MGSLDDHKGFEAMHPQFRGVEQPLAVAAAAAATTATG